MSEHKNSKPEESPSTNQALETKKKWYDLMAARVGLLAAIIGLIVLLIGLIPNPDDEEGGLVEERTLVNFGLSSEFEGKDHKLQTGYAEVTEVVFRDSLQQDVWIYIGNGRTHVETHCYKANKKCRLAYPFIVESKFDIYTRWRYYDADNTIDQKSATISGDNLEFEVLGYGE